MRKEDEEDIANGGSRMMPLPVMKEEDLIRIIKRQKNGKAAGTDGVKTETMKHMVKNKKIRKGLVNAFNKCLKEKVHPNWMESNTTMLPKTKKNKHKRAQTNCCYQLEQQGILHIYQRKNGDSYDNMGHKI